jgi:hypothetical protein
MSSSSLIRCVATTEAFGYPADCVKKVRECYAKKAKDPSHVRVCKRLRDPIVGSFMEGLILWSI